MHASLIKGDTSRPQIACTPEEIPISSSITLESSLLPLGSSVSLLESRRLASYLQNQKIPPFGSLTNDENLGCSTLHRQVMAAYLPGAKTSAIGGRGSHTDFKCHIVYFM